MGNTLSKQLFAGLVLFNLSTTRISASVQADQQNGKPDIDPHIDQQLRRLLSGTYPIFASVDGSPIPIEVPVDGTVKDIKDEVTTATGYHFFSLLYQDETLNDFQKELADLGIGPETMVTVVPKVPLKELREQYPTQNAAIDSIVLKLMSVPKESASAVFWKPPRGVDEEPEELLIVKSFDKDDSGDPELRFDRVIDATFRRGRIAGLHIMDVIILGTLGPNGEWTEWSDA